MRTRMSVLVVVVCIAVLMLTIGLPVSATVPGHGGAPVAKRSPMTSDVTAHYVGTRLASGQPSPYCNIGTPSQPVIIMCYTPQDIRTAYNYPSYLDGRGQTIVIIDAFGDPTVQSDLNMFDAEYGLPATTIQIVCQGGTCPVYDPTNADMVSWALEITLDTQVAHAMAPGAHIILYVAQLDDDLTMVQAAASAIAMFPHSIISQSWGDAELDMLQGTCNPYGPCSPSYVQDVLSTGERAYRQAAQEGTTVFAAAGDWGADNSVVCPGCTSANPIYPSSSPWVTGVGGTEGYPYYFGSIPNCGTNRTCSTGLVNFLNSPACQLSNQTPPSSATCQPIGYGGEQVWNDANTWPYSTTGGAPSLIFGTPFYQRGLGLPSRATPDVSYFAAGSGGPLLYWSTPPTAPGFYIFYGTSSGSPQWAAVAALADQLAVLLHRGTLGFINPELYSIGNNPYLYRFAFHDITVGNNTDPDGLNVGFSATPGWDDASGWGTPNVANLVLALALMS